MIRASNFNRRYAIVAQLTRNDGGERPKVAVIAEAKDAGAKFPFRVIHGFSDCSFHTFAEANAYCQKHGWAVSSHRLY